MLASLAGGLLAGVPGATEPGRIVVLLVLVAVLSGALQFIYGLAGGGKLIKYIPYPVVSGYMSAVGVLIFLSQLPKFLGLPGAGTMGATLVSIESGGRTKLAGLLEGAFVLVAALVLGSMIAWVPVAALAGILIVVAVRMCDWGSLRLLRQKSTVLDFVVIATVVVVAVATDLIAAAAAGVALSMLLFIREQIRGSVIRRKMRGDRVSSKQHRLPEEQAVLDRLGAQITACELQGSLFFGTTDQLYTELAPDLKECRYLILDLRRIQSLDC